MLDDLHSDGQPDRTRTPPETRRQPTDREVPIGPSGLTLGEALHAWLDGDGTEEMARREQSRGDVEFWKRLDVDLARRRAARPRAGFAARVMRAIRAAEDEK